MEQNLRIRPAAWPAAARLTITLFLVLTGLGYLSAVGNLYHQHALADGRAGLTLDDLRVTFHGMDVERPQPKPRAGSGRLETGPTRDSPTRDGASREGATGPMSRMLEMIQPGAKMRKELISGGEPAVRALTAWLERGATKAEFETTGLAQAGDPSAAKVLDKQCLNCHNADGGDKEEAPFGPDAFTLDYDMVARFAVPDAAAPSATATEIQPPAGATALAAAASQSAPDSTMPQAAATERRGPMSLSHLFLITHIHMLSIPVFTLIVAVLFMLCVGANGLRGWAAALPMALLCIDFACWWGARAWEPLIYLIAAAGAMYGAALGGQLVVVLWWLWTQKRA